MVSRFCINFYLCLGSIYIAFITEFICIFNIFKTYLYLFIVRVCECKHELALTYTSAVIRKKIVLHTGSLSIDKVLYFSYCFDIFMFICVCICIFVYGEFSISEPLFCLLLQYLETMFTLLFQLLQQVTECDTKMHVLHVLSCVIERVNVQVICETKTSVRWKYI